MRPRGVRLTGIITLALLFHGLSVQAGVVPIKGIVDKPADYDGTTVTVKGKALDVKPTTSRRGNPYTTFQVADPSGASLKVFTWGHPSIDSGDTVEVTGTFRRAKQVGRYTFNNELDASTVKKGTQ